MAEKRAELQSYYDNGVIVYGNDPGLIPRFISTGIKELDGLLNGGFKRGASSMFAGMEGQGKTWTAQKACGAAIANGLGACYINMERAYDPVWWQQVGVDISKLEVATPASGEECIDVVSALLQDGIDLIVLDSHAAMIPMAEEDSSAEANLMGLQARLSGKLYRAMNVFNKNTHVMVINQIREKIGVIYGNPQTIPGGKAKDFFSSSIIQCKRDSWIEDGKVRKGWHLKYEIVGKHRGASNLGDFATVPVLFSGKVDEVNQIIQMALVLGVIKQSGAFYTIVDKEGEVLGKAQGRGNLSQLLESDDSLYQRLLGELP